jgi:hypothetical protein
MIRLFINLWFRSVAMFASNFSATDLIFPVVGVATNAIGGIPNRASIGKEEFRLAHLRIASGAYLTGGLTVQASDFGLRSLRAFAPVCAQGGGYTIVLDSTGLKIQVFQSAAGAGQHAELANAAAVVVDIIVIAFGEV